MTRIRRGGYVFVTWIGDHPPRHVHVYQDDQLVLVWDLSANKSIRGEPSRRLVRMIGELRLEGLL